MSLHFYGFGSRIWEWDTQKLKGVGDDALLLLLLLLRWKQEIPIVKSILLDLESGMNQNLNKQWEILLARSLIEPQSLKGERDLSNSVFSFYKRRS